MKTLINSLTFMALLLGSTYLSATTMFQVGLEQLAIESEQIVHAEVTAIITKWDKDSSIIQTYVRMNIKDDLIGNDEDNEIIIKLIGGNIGTMKLTVEGSTTYKVGEENILFLYQDPNNSATYQTIGMYQGKYTVYRDSEETARVAQDSSQSVALVKRLADPDILETGNKMRLDEFKALIKSYRNN